MFLGIDRMISAHEAPESSNARGWELALILIMATIQAFVLLHPSSIARAGQQNFNAVIINSYHHGYEWSDREIAGLLERLREVYPAADPSIEHMDAKRYPDEKQMIRVRDYLAAKYAGNKIDLILTLDNPALDMMLRYRSELFPGVPIVFGGINDFQPAMIEGYEKVTGVAEVQDNTGTLKMALGLHPKCKEVLVIHDYTSSGLALRREFEAAASIFQGRVHIRFTPPSTFEEVLQQMKSLPADAIGLILTFTTDSSGRSLQLPESTRMLTSVTSVPVYAMHETRLGYGIVGGMLISGKEHGRRVGDIALRILDGEDPASIPVDTRGVAFPMFDYRVLERFGIPGSSLPQGSKIINSPELFFEKYKGLVLGAATALTSLCAIIIFLVFLIMRLRRTESALSEKNMQLEAALPNLEQARNMLHLIIESIPVRVFWKDRNSRYLGCNSLFARDAGMNHPDELLGKDDFAMQWAEQADLYRADDRLVIGSGLPKKDIIEPQTTPNGTVIWLITSKVPLRMPSGEIFGVLGLYEDITERKKAEEALHTNEERLSMSIAASGQGIWDWDIARDEAYLSPMYYELIGYEEGEIHPNLNFFQTLIHPDDLPVVSRTMEEHLQGKTEYSIVEYRRRKKSGEYCWTYGVGKVVERDQSGSPVRMLGVISDITERKLAETALAQSEQQFKLLYERAPIAYQSLNENGDFIEVNPAWLEALGYTKAEVIGKNFGDFLHPDWVNHFKENFPRFKAIGEILGVEFEMVKKDGSTMLVSFRGKVGLDPLGQFKQTHCVFHDITQQRRVEERLRESEQRFRSLFENSPLAYQSLDLEGRFIDVNPELCNLLGYRPDELLGRSFGELWPENSRQAFFSQFEMFKQKGEVNSELHLIANDGQDVFVILEGRIQQDVDGNFVRTHCILTDITERKRTEETLRLERNRAQSYLDTVETIIVALDTEGKITTINRKGCEVFGRAENELVGQFWFLTCLSQPDGMEKVYPLFLKLRAGEMASLEYFENSIVTRSGELRQIAWHNALLRDGQGHVVGTLSSGEDITERKKMLQTLSALAAIVESSDDAIIGKDLDGIITNWNLGAENIYGYSKSEVIGKPISILLPPGHNDDFLRILEKIKSGEHIENYETVRRRKDNRDISVSLTVSPVRNADGRIEAASTIARDITGRKMAEKALHAASRYARSLIEASLDPLVTISPDGKITDANAATETVTGYDRTHLIGTDFSDYFTEPEQAKAGYQEAFREGFVRDYPLNIQHRDGQVTPVLYNASVYRDGEGQIAGVFAAARDVSDRIRATEEKEKLHQQLLQAHKIEAVGRLAGGVAHDFNNMLGVILGHAEMALDQTNPQDDRYIDLQEIQKAALRSADLTRQLLAFARKQTVSPKVLDLNESVSSMIKMLQRLIGEDIDLAWLPGHHLWSVKIDPSQVDQMLANLAINARDAISGVGKVTIETANVVVDDKTYAERQGIAPGEYVSLAVSDTGAGMSEEILAHIFEPFFTTKDVGKGTGLGLATLYGVVKQNQGFVDVHSEPNQGTTFKIYLPRFKGEIIDPVTEILRKKPPVGDETVLLVEDEEAIMHLGKAILSRLGYRVLTATSPGKAIRLAGEYTGDIQLLVTDVVMPEMNGRELAERLSSMRPGLKCLFMSGYTADIIAHSGVLDDGIHFIQKPFSMNDIAEKVRETLAG